MRMYLSRARKGRVSVGPKIAAIAVAAALTIAGCSGAGTSDSSSAGGKPAKGGTVVAALSGDPQTLDMAQNSGSLTIRVAMNIFEQLFALDKDYQPAPMLADSYKRSDDGLRYTIKLRTGVKFQNGDPLTAADVVASLKRWEQVSGTGKLAAKDIASIDAQDDSTVGITLSKPRYSLIGDLAYNVQAAIIVPASVAESAGTSPIPDDKIIGTGPYKLKDYQHGQSVVLTRYDGYKSRDDKSSGVAGAKTAYVDNIDFRFVADPAQQLNGLKSGQFQWAQAVSADEYDALKNDPSVDSSVSDTGLVATVLINHNANSAFKDLKARQGLNMLIDKKAMAQASFGPDVFWTPLDGAMVFSVDKPMYSEAGKDIYQKHDEKAAKKLLEGAGISADKPIRIFTTQTYPKYYQMAVVLQAELEKIGLKADVQVYDFPTMISKLTSDPTDWDISFTSFSGTVTSPSQVLSLTPTWPGEYKSDKLDALMDKYSASKDAKEAKGIVDDIQQLMWDDLPVISVAPNKTFMVNSKKLKDVSPFTQGIFWNCYLSA